MWKSQLKNSLTISKWYKSSLFPEILLLLTRLTTTNSNLTTQIRYQEDQIPALKAEMWNLKFWRQREQPDMHQETEYPVEREANTTHERKMHEDNGQTIRPRKYNNNKNNCCSHRYNKSDPHSSSTYTHTKYLYKTEGTICNPMTGFQVNKLQVWKKFRKRVG